MNKIEQNLSKKQTSDLLLMLKSEAGAMRFFVFEELAQRFSCEPEIEKDLMRALLSDENRNIRFHGVTSLSQMALLVFLQTETKAAKMLVSKVLDDFSPEDRSHFSSLTKRESRAAMKPEKQAA